MKTGASRRLGYSLKIVGQFARRELAHLGGAKVDRQAVGGAGDILIARFAFVRIARVGVAGGPQAVAPGQKPTHSRPCRRHHQSQKPVSFGGNFVSIQAHQKRSVGGKASQVAAQPVSQPRLVVEVSV